MRTSLSREILHALNRSFEEIDLGGVAVARGHDVVKVFNQTAFRWRNDDGSESAATWVAALNTNPTSGDLTPDTNYRIRIECEETASGTTPTWDGAQLQYNKNSAGWVNVNGSSSNVRSSASPNVDDAATTTNQLTGTGTSALTFDDTYTGFDEVNGLAGAGNWAASSTHMEAEFCFQLRSADLVDSDVIQLRVARFAAGTPVALDTYTQTPSYTYSSAAASAAITGTATASITEADVVAGGKTIIITLTGDTWVTAGATFDGQRANIAAGIDSAQSEATGWDAVVKAGIDVGDVVRTSDTVVTVTLDAEATYNITAQETITVTIPSTALTGAVQIVATPTFTVNTVGGTAVKDIIGGGFLVFPR